MVFLMSDLPPPPPASTPPYGSSPEGRHYPSGPNPTGQPPPLEPSLPPPPGPYDLGAPLLPPLGPSGAEPFAGYRGRGLANEHLDTTTVLVLGILAVAICPILGPFAWSQGNRALNEIDASRGTIGGASSVKAGRICGMVGSVILLLILVYFLFWLAILGVAAANS